MKTLAVLGLEVGDSVLVPVALQNREAWMVLNMASAFSTIRESAVADLKLPTQALPARNPIMYFGDKPVTQLVSMPPLMLGAVRFKKDNLVVEPASRESQWVDGRPIVGALGMDALWSYDFELDLAGRKLSLYGQSHCASGDVVYWAERFARLPMDFGDLGTIHMTAELDGRKIEASLSTTSSATTLTREAARRLFGVDAHSPNIEFQNDNGGRREAVLRAMELTSGPLTLKDVRIKLVPAGKDCRLTIGDGPEGTAAFEGCFGRSPLVLGRGVIEKLRLYFATAEKAIYYSGQDAPADATTLR